MSADCEYYESLISQMLDGELTDAETDDLRAHIRACGDCAKLFRAFSAVAAAMREDEAEPPAALARGVMDRVRTWDAGEDASPAAPVDISSARTRRKKRSSGRWQSAAIAACLVVIIGGGAYIAGNLFLDRKGAGSATVESITMEAALQEAPAAAPMQEEDAAMDGAMLYAAAEEVAEEPAAMDDKVPTGAGMLMDTAPAEDSADHGAMDSSAQMSAARRAVYTVDAPAQVPEDRQEDFEFLLRTARGPEDFEAQWRTVAAVEYRGIIYEFLTDENETYLLWKDAAEGMPAFSPGTINDLWDIIG